MKLIIKGTTLCRAYMDNEIVGIKYQTDPDIKKITFCEENLVKIPPGITSIAEDAFENIEGLKKVILPDTVMTIEDRAFSGCENLEEIFIPYHVKRIGKNAFKDVRHIQLCDNHPVYYMQDDMLIEKRGKMEVLIWVSGIKQNIVIPNQVSEIEDNVFRENYNIKSIIFSKQFTCVEEGMFRNCIALRRVFLPEKVAVIKKRAFENCLNLQAVVMDHPMVYIEQGEKDAFYNVTDTVFFCRENRWMDNYFAEHGFLWADRKEGDFLFFDSDRKAEEKLLWMREEQKKNKEKERQDKKWKINYGRIIKICRQVKDTEGKD